ncbi:MAG TPA: hypothetical protein VFE61_18940 [Candidatus Sulfotelmatobacter sp.]|jgi:hypothetical protein|nr:hypothetical protein [Candidatus Sulfotelmatobacter sp.]
MKRHHTSFYRRFATALVWVCAVFMPLYLIGADTQPKVVLDAGKAGPRAIESLTERSVVRDYRFAWASLAQALELNSSALLSGLFEGTARTWLNDAVMSQRRSGLSSRYLNQNHKVDAVFYAPEGDVIELHDTADYDLQILDGSKIIHNEHVAVRYVVLMTPAADRWVIRQIQAVPEF